MIPESSLTPTPCINMSANSNTNYSITPDPARFHHRDMELPTSPKATLEALRRPQLAWIISALVFISPHQCLGGD